VVVEEKYEIPGRVYPYRDGSKLTTSLCKVLDQATAILSPLIKWVDGERVAQFVLRAI
jgi:hypothetical protein